MDSERQPAPLIVLVGPTASGKSAIAMALARKFNGEIICADSRTVYAGMDIGTAKPSAADREAIRHYLLDVARPDQAFTAAEFKRQALEAIKTISKNDKLPLMVGGTGLYVDGVIFDFAFLPPVAPEVRAELQNLSVAELQERLLEQGIPLPENAQNPRHLIRAIETNGAIAVRKGLRANTLVLGLDISKDLVTQRIHERIRKMAEAGLKQEVEKLAALYGWQAPGMSAVGYREWLPHFEAHVPVPEILADIEANTLQYAKRQRTWFKRNEHIVWIKNSAEAMLRAKEFLHKEPS